VYVDVAVVFEDDFDLANPVALDDLLGSLFAMFKDVFEPRDTMAKGPAKAATLLQSENPMIPFMMTDNPRRRELWVMRFYSHIFRRVAASRRLLEYT
jgi:hypothetical protein